jgi:ABC-type nitrate/sulfonate/bicarbonate transport system substrate-binding protein
MALIIKAAWPNPQRNSFKIPFEMAARQLQRDKDATLEYTPFMGAQKEFQALLEGEVDVAFATAPQMVSLSNSEANVRLVLGYLQRQPFRLVTRSNIQTIKDLKGKTVSVQLGAGISEQTVRFTMGAAGLTEGEDYNLVPIIPIPDIFNALVSGTIDGGPLGLDSAYHFMEQYPSDFHILGGSELGQLPEMVVVGWITTEQILRDRPEAVELFISYLGAAYDEAYSSDVSTLAQIDTLFHNYLSMRFCSRSFSCRVVFHRRPPCLAIA